MIKHKTRSLMHEIEIHVIASPFGESQEAVDHRGYNVEGELDQLRSVHKQAAGPALALAGLDGMFLWSGPAFGNHQSICYAPVGAENEMAQRRLIGCLDQGGGSAVAENGAQGPIDGVNVLGVSLGSDKQHPARLAAADQTVARQQSIDN